MATLRDIANACGVSTATVSYVVNKGPRPVLPATRERVLKAISELGYHPNAHARGLRGMRTQTLGVVFPHVTLPFENVYFGPVLEGILEVSTDRHMATMLFTAFTREEAETAAPRLCDGRCDGFIVAAPWRKSRLVEELVARQVPVVVVGTHPDDVSVSTVDADNVEGGKLATQHLIRLGHRRIGVSPFTNTTTSSPERVEGYRLALLSAGIAYDPRLVARISDEDFTQEEALRELLDRPDRPTALFAVQDAVAMLAIRVANEMGLRIPEDLSVVGFDDCADVRAFAPPITTVRQPMRQIGLRAAQLLCERIDAPASEPTRLLLDVHLIERSSTARRLGVAAKAS